MRSESVSGDLTVGIVIEDLEAGGAPWNYIKAVPGALAEQESVTPVVVYRRGDSSRFGAAVDTVKLPDRSYPTPWLPDRPFPARLAAVEPLREFDIFHLNTIPDIGHCFAFEVDTPVVSTVHGTLHWETPPIPLEDRWYRVRRRWFDRLGRYTLDRLLAVSEYVRDTMVENAGYRLEQVTTTHEAIDDSFFSVAPSDGLDSMPDPFLLHVSNAAPKKNMDTLLAALSILRREGVDIDLVVAGDRWQSTGPSLAAAHGVADHVHFLGYVTQEHLVHLYDKAQCFVYPSYHETFGLPNVEAMARGTPVVTTSAYAIPEIVADGALTIEDPSDAAELATGIRAVLDDAALRRRLSSAGKRRAENFRWTNHSDRLVATYRSVLSS